MLKIILSFFLFSTVLYSKVQNDSKNLIDSLTIILEKEMLKRNEYDKAKELRISNLKVLISENSITNKNKFFLIDKLITEYEYYNFDSTLEYMEKSLKLAHKIKDPFYLQKSSIRLAKLLATSGRYKESIDILKKINSKNLDLNLNLDYYFSYKECYDGLHFFSKVNILKKEYSLLSKAYNDSLNIEMSKLDPNSLKYLRSVEENYRNNHQFKKALIINSKRLSKVKMGTRDYAMITYERSYTNAAFFGDGSNKHKKFLFLSAISDIKASIKDNASLTDLAKIFYLQGDIDAAYKYVNFSFQDAKFYNSKLRFLNISNILLVISESYEKQSLLQKTKLKRNLLYTGFLLLIVILTLLFIYLQFRKLKVTRNKLKTVNNKLKNLNTELSYTNSDLKRLYKELSDSDRIKEHYIGTFLNLYSDYIDKLDVYRKTVSKYIITNKTKDLLELSKSKKIIESELKIFYDDFDKSFLHIYPNFIKNFNALLKEDEKIIVEEDDSLTVELRIFALIRLGITKSSKISKILRYSVNTIYNYRVKVRNIALNREEFEDMVKKIK